MVGSGREKDSTERRREGHRQGYRRREKGRETSEFRGDRSDGNRM